MSWGEAYTLEDSINSVLWRLPPHFLFYQYTAWSFTITSYYVGAIICYYWLRIYAGIGLNNINNGKIRAITKLFIHHFTQHCNEGFDGCSSHPILSVGAAYRFMLVSKLLGDLCSLNTTLGYHPEKKHLYNIYKTLVQRLRCWPNIV